MKNMKRVFLVHGWEAKPDQHWFPWISRELVEYGFTVFAPSMPGTNAPKLSEWLAELERVVVMPDKDTYFVGHSLGCITIARYLASLTGKTRAGGCVFVGGFSGELDWAPEIAEFWKTPFVPELAKKHCRAFVSIASDDDDSVPIERSREFNTQLGGKIVEEKGKGHFCMSDGVTQLPSALNAVLELAGIKK